MTEIILDIVADAFADTAKIVPFLFAVYLLIEYTEHKHADALPSALKKLGIFGSAGGALLGSIPQCGFSAAVSNLYAGRLISLGTLISVYLATSDEAIPLLISNPESVGSIWQLVAVKIIIAMIAGLVVDLLLRLIGSKKNDEPQYEELCRSCDCEHHSIAVSALKHTVQITIFILVINLLLGAAFEFVGANGISKFMMQNSALQPLVAAIFGFIPNCASSVVITQLYIEGVLSFGSCVAGLCTGAGVGLIVLFKTNKNLKENLCIMGILYLTAALSGIILNLIF